MKQKFLKLCILILTVSTLSGCYRINYSLSDANGSTHRSGRWKQYFLLGIVPETEYYNVNAMCPFGKVVEVRTSQKATNVIASIFGVGITGSSTVEVICVK